LIDRPVLVGLALEIAKAFDVISRRRTSGMGPNPISLCEIESYISLFGPPTIELDLFIELLDIADQKFLELKVPNGNKSASNS
jgi:hypothetical protein